MKKTIAQQLNIKDFPFRIRDKDEKVIYSEYSDNTWERVEYDSDGNNRYYENSDGITWKRDEDWIAIHLDRDNRPKKTRTVNDIIAKDKRRKTMKDYSVIPFLICLAIFLLTAVLSIIFIRQGNVWAIMLVGIAGMVGVVAVNEIAQRIREK